MIRGLVGRGFIFIAFVLALVSPVAPVFGYVVAGLVAVAFFLCCSCQKAIWLDGWHAAHDHHRIEDGHAHLEDFRNFLSRQGWH